jgi:hypothetical protein
MVAAEARSVREQSGLVEQGRFADGVSLLDLPSPPGRLVCSRQLSVSRRLWKLRGQLLLLGSVWPPRWENVRYVRRRNL